MLDITRLRDASREELNRAYEECDQGIHRPSEALEQAAYLAGATLAGTIGLVFMEGASHLGRRASLVCALVAGICALVIWLHWRDYYYRARLFQACRDEFRRRRELEE